MEESSWEYKDKARRASRQKRRKQDERSNSP